MSTRIYRAQLCENYAPSSTDRPSPSIPSQPQHQSVFAPASIRDYSTGRQTLTILVSSHQPTTWTRVHRSGHPAVCTCWRYGSPSPDQPCLARSEGDLFIYLRLLYLGQSAVVCRVSGHGHMRFITPFLIANRHLLN